MTPTTIRAVMVLMAMTSGFVFAPAGARAQQARAPLVVVLDGSNSMNGRLPGDSAPKHVLVREALRRALPALTGLRVGLAGFGHRRASDCNDAAMISAPVADPQVLMSNLERFRPRGFSPVALALREASAAFAGAPGPAALLLVLDDLASCRTEDPCTTATELAARNPALSIDVLGLGLNAQAAERMACVASVTNGRLANIQDGREIDAALASLLLKAVPKAPPAAARSGADKAAVRPASAAFEPPVPAGPGLYLSARLSASGPALGRVMRWMVTRQDDASDAIPVAEIDDPAPVLDLPPGAYRILVQAGPVVRHLTAQIAEKEPTVVTAVLDAALARISVSLAKGGASAPGVLVTASPAGADTSQRPTLIVRPGEEEQVLPAGTWRLSAAAGAARAEQTVSLAAGSTTAVDLALAAGRLVVTAEPAAAGTFVAISEDDPDSPDGRKEIARAASAASVFVLPAGAYNITVRSGTTEARDRVIVGAGEEVRRRIGVGASRLRVTGRLPGGAERAGLLTRVLRIDGAEREIARSSSLEPQFELTQGRYRIEQRAGGQNALVRRDLDMRADGEQRIALDHVAGTVQLRLALAAGSLQFGEVFWTIRDGTGQQVLRTGQPEPLAILAPGRYVAEVEARGARFERSFEVRAGETSRQELGG